MIIEGVISQGITPYPLFKYDWHSEVMPNKCQLNHVSSYCALKTWFTEYLKVYAFAKYTPDKYKK